jgi:outer membrane protein OmpA-like peptidoglycan-associated protein
MKTKHLTSTGGFSAMALLALCAFAPQAASAQDELDGNPNPVNYGTIPLSYTMEPTTSMYGTVGMITVLSAEPLGAGRLGIHGRLSFVEQNKTQAGSLPKGTQIVTATGGAALGLNPYIDGFFGISLYNTRGDAGSTSGAGTAVLGAQGTMPLPEAFPIRLGFQVSSLFGTAGGTPLNSVQTEDGKKGAYGYNYLENRKFTDVMGKFIQSFVFAGENMGLKLHLNEGIISSFEPGKGVLLVTGAGAQFFVAPPIVLGVEVNSRTFLANATLTDPFWVTPSVVIRTPAHFNVEVGADVSLSGDRADGTRTLEPWRAFAGISLAYDTQKKMRMEREERARREAMEKAALARKARQAEIDRLAQKRIADSLAVKAYQDSVILVATQRALARATNGRSEAEEQLLGTGMLLMDAVYFETGKTDISINSKPYLNLIAKMLAKYPKLKIEVAGHTDNVGGADFNMGLSQDRAAAVKSYMSNVSPALADQLSARGYGLTQPKADNDTEDGRMRNRRIELRITNREALKEYNP